MEIFPGEQKEDDRVCVLLPTEAVLSLPNETMQWNGLRVLSRLMIGHDDQLTIDVLNLDAKESAHDLVSSPSHLRLARTFAGEEWRRHRSDNTLSSEESPAFIFGGNDHR